MTNESLTQEEAAPVVPKVLKYQWRLPNAKGPKGSRRDSRAKKATASNGDLADEDRGPVSATSRNSSRGEPHDGLFEDKAFVPVSSNFHGGSDPFNCTSVPVEPWTNTLLQYYLWVVTAAIYPAEVRCSPLARHTYHVLNDLRDCMSDSTLMYALLASSCSHMQLFRGIRCPTGPEQDPLYFKTQSIRGLRNMVAQNKGLANNDMIRPIFMLAGAELWARQTDAVVCHVKALKYIVQAMGGMKMVDPWRMERILLADIKCSAQRLTAPQFPLDWDPGDARPELEVLGNEFADPTLDGLGKRLLGEKNREVLGPEIRAVVKDLVKVHRITAYIIIHPEATAPRDYAWLSLRTAACESRILRLIADVHAVGGESGKQQECCLLAILLCVNEQWPNTRRALVKHLKAALMFCELVAFWAPHTELLLWVLALGAMASETADDEAVFAAALKTVASSRQGLDMETMRKLLTEHLYVDRLSHAKLKRLMVRLEVSVVPVGATALSFHVDKMRVTC